MINFLDLMATGLVTRPTTRVSYIDIQLRSFNVYCFNVSDLRTNSTDSSLFPVSILVSIFVTLLWVLGGRHTAARRGDRYEAGQG